MMEREERPNINCGGVDCSIRRELEQLPADDDDVQQPGRID
jgi:hypothetical protein